MMLKPDQERIKSLLSETITLLCRNGLNFKSEFSVEALIGITLDQTDVFLVSIKETVQSADAAAKVIQEPATTWAETIDNHSNGCSSPETKVHGAAIRKDAIGFRAVKRNDFSFKYTRNVMRRASSTCEDNSVAKGTTGRRRDKLEGDNVLGESDVSSSRIKRARIDSPARTANETTDKDENNKSLNSREFGDNQKVGQEDENGFRNVSPQSSPRLEALNVKNEPPSVHRSWSSYPDNQTMPSFDHQSHVNQTIQPHEENQGDILVDNDEIHDDDNDTDDVVFVKNEPSEFDTRKGLDINDTYDQWIGDSSAQWTENTGYKSGGWMDGEDMSGGQSGTPRHRPKLPRYRPRLTGQVIKTAGSYEYDGMDMELSGNASSSAVTDHSSHYPSSVTQPDILHTNGAPDLSVDELVIARSVLTMHGNFISLGCLKANRQLLRRVSREQLMNIINKMSKPTDPAYFIGLLFDFGISRVFYKCPPASVSEVALRFYGFSGAHYQECYLRQVIVDKNIRDPESWIQRLQERSPFSQQ